ncbi:G-type lectin S-receptor-like serine/threonine-protein kinase SD3-1 [Hevea brasiliensis]|uniref:G-type lectin S-receptor-like serine/threonine-protein kinase SD3-1 n=1 Tax=Hevea brasiliensis TaxID=3981 RepID=UPI0025DB168A|nr:G-type lectin S-receptor-like serine/threonine-protein kinase SD3-1 [Hevea brasiliensis]
MWVASPREPDFEIPIKHFQGKTNRFRFSSVLAVVLSLCFVSCGFCDEPAMVSAPLGFEISGFDRTRTWVSQNGVFAFGFLECCQKDDDGFLVGVRYNLGDKTVNIPVWAVGGGLRVSMNSTIKLSMDGRLILFENPSGLIFWSSSTSSLGVKKATLLNNGNLVLVGNGDRVLWESFHSPTSTLLPGQSLLFPQTLRAPSTKSISSYYNFVIRRSGELALVWENNVTYWSSHLSFSSSITIKEARFDADGFLRLIDGTNRTVWSTSSNDFKDPSVTLRHLRMDSDGNLRIYSWDNVLHEWKIAWQAVGNQCDVFGSCGLYGLCRFNSTGPVCDCLYQDSSNWGASFVTMDSGGFGCKKMVDLSNCKMNTSMLDMKQSVLYGLYPPQDVHMMLNEKKCKEYCSNDPTCIAATSKNDGSGICTIKRTSFISGYRNPSVPATSFLKVCLVPQAVSAQQSDPHFNPKPIPTLSKGFIDREVDNKKFVGAVALVVFVTVSGLLTFETFVFWFVYHRRKIKAQARIPFSKDAQMNAHYSVLIRLSFEEIKDLTGNFADQLGPTVYKGVLPNKRPVIAKKLNDATANEKDFRVAVSNLGGMHHRNLVSLKGFCFEANHRFLLYDYVHNGSLDNWLFNMEQGQNDGNLQQRFDIALGVARALAYLHSECQVCVAHGNLKLENVLLDEKLAPKLTDFGLRSLLQKEAASSSESPAERDIYMFGEMLLQIVTHRRDILSNSLQHLTDSMDEKLNLEDCTDSEGISRVMRIALWCMQNQPFLRPTIVEVVKVLEGTLSVDRPPFPFTLRQDQMDEAALSEIQVGS